jgi:hypothetical protein
MGVEMSNFSTIFAENKLVVPILLMLGTALLWQEGDLFLILISKLRTFFKVRGLPRLPFLILATICFVVGVVLKFWAFSLLWMAVKAMSMLVGIWPGLSESDFFIFLQAYPMPFLFLQLLLALTISTSLYRDPELEPKTDDIVSGIIGFF